MNNCCICFDKEWVSRTPCNHYICITCLIKLPPNEQKILCPICRKKLNLPEGIINVRKKRSPYVLNIEDFPPLS